MLRRGLLLILCAASASGFSGLVMQSGSTVAVTGSTGRLGRKTVEALVAKGYQVRALARHKPSTAEDASASAKVLASLSEMPGVELVQGDVTNPDSINELLKGCSACLAMHGAVRTRKLSDLWQDSTLDPQHAKNVNYQGVANIIEAAKANNCKRIVRITGKGETPWSIFSILINGLGCMAKAWNYEGENLLRSSGVDYTIIRPGVMGDKSQENYALADDGGDLKVAPIRHEAIADLAVEVLAAPNAAKSTLCAMTVPAGEGAESWGPLVGTVQPDRRAFRGKDLLEEAHQAVRVAGAGFGMFLAVIAAAVLKALLGIMA